MTQIVDRNLADKIAMLLDEGLLIEDVAQLCNVSQNVVSFIEHDVGLNAYVGISQERLEELADKNILLAQTHSDLRDYSSKQLGKWLIQAGLLPGQIHHCTALSIHKCRHLYRQVKALFNTAEQIPMPQSNVSRLIMSIFATHYLYYDGNKQFQLEHAIVAWGRTIEDVINLRLDQLEGFDPRLITLGSLLKVAQDLRGSQKDDDGCRKITRSYCPNCGSHFVWFLSARRHKASQCCFCELLKSAQSAGQKQKKTTRGAAKQNKKVAS